MHQHAQIIIRIYVYDTQLLKNIKTFEKSASNLVWIVVCQGTKSMSTHDCRV